MIVATVASLAFLAASCGFLAWVLNDRAGDTVSVSARLAAETTITTAVTTAAPTAQAASDVPPTTEDVAGPGPTDAPAATAPVASAPAATQAAPLREAGPLAPDSVTASNTRETTPSLRCGGGSISYFAGQLIDGTDLGWGASHTDGTGEYADIAFGRNVHLSAVGITPGYLRQAERQSNNCQPASSFGYNRFVNSVRWTFDDGTTVVQEFEQVPEMQTIPVDVDTSTIRLTVLETTRPAGADDDTVISEAAFTGVDSR